MHNNAIIHIRQVVDSIVSSKPAQLTPKTSPVTTTFLLNINDIPLNITNFMSTIRYGN
ncbi:hypothetical protein Hanom_Chr09g00863851 [Helianthus anomalus]